MSVLVVNLNPASPDYISKRIGDQYMEWDETNRRYRTYGDFPNLSNLVYVELNATIADGGGQGFLPAGFYGPVRPKGFRLQFGSKGANFLNDVDNSGTVPPQRQPGLTVEQGLLLATLPLFMELLVEEPAVSEPKLQPFLLLLIMTIMLKPGVVTHIL